MKYAAITAMRAVGNLLLVVSLKTKNYQLKLIYRRDGQNNRSNRLVYQEVKIWKI
ncbi:MAG: hypothetical protein AB1393_11895 [Candidatus Edwardsbacteria bacterium]